MELLAPFWPLLGGQSRDLIRIYQTVSKWAFSEVGDSLLDCFGRQHRDKSCGNCGKLGSGARSGGGDYTNVVGLPLAMTARMLGASGINS
jgi:predicted house-cleaning NTP pyrophosphatase (Maf/HAM1 superfamily)